MSLIIPLLLLSVVCQCWTAPQRRNWTPQAILYLKGARKNTFEEGHRSVLARTTREEGGTLGLVSLIQSDDGLGPSRASAVLLKLLQRAVEEGGRNPDSFPESHEQNYL